MPLYQQQEALLKSLCCFQKPPRLNISFNVVLLSFFFLILSFSTHIFPQEKSSSLLSWRADKPPNIKFYNIMKKNLSKIIFCVCQFAVVFVCFKRHSSSSPSLGSRFSQSKLTPFKVQKILLSLYSWGIQEMVLPKRKSAYSFLRSTRCILKVLGDVFEWAIMRLRSSPNAPSATSCTLIGPMLPLIRKDL